MPMCAGPPGAGPEAQLEGDRAQSVPTTPSTSCGAMPASASAPSAPSEGDGGRIVARAGHGLHRVVDADDGDAGEGMARSRRILSHHRARWPSDRIRAPGEDERGARLVADAPRLACATAGRVSVRTPRGSGGWEDRGPVVGEWQACSVPPSGIEIAASCFVLALPARGRCARRAAARGARCGIAWSPCPKVVGLPVRNAAGPPGLPHPSRGRSRWRSWNIPSRRARASSCSTRADRARAAS